MSVQQSFRFKSKFKKHSLIYSIAMLIAAVYLVPFTARGLFRILVVKQSPKVADAIVILLGGKRPERIRDSVSLIKMGFAPRVVFGTGFWRTNYSYSSFYEWVPAGQIYKENLLKAGIQPHQITIISTPNASDTVSELRYIRSYVRTQKWKQIILVTTSTHSRRVKMIWDRLCPDIAAVIIAAKDEKLVHWWTSWHGVNTMLHEYLGMSKELLRQVKIGFQN